MESWVRVTRPTKVCFFCSSWGSTGFHKHKTSKAKGNDKRGVPREGTGVVFRLSSPVACFVERNVETSLSWADKSVDTPCKIHKPRNFGLVILSRWLKFSRYNTVAIHSKPVLINYDAWNWLRRVSTPVSTVLRNSVRFLINKYIVIKN